MRTLLLYPAPRLVMLLALSVPAMTALAQGEKKEGPPADGSVKVYDKKGERVIGEDHYQGGVLHGPSKRFDRFGVAREAIYFNGKLEGAWREYREGRLVVEMSFHEGKEDGEWIFHPTGGKGFQIKGVQHWKEGMPEGLWHRNYFGGARGEFGTEKAM